MTAYKTHAILDGLEAVIGAIDGIDEVRRSKADFIHPPAPVTAYLMLSELQSRPGDQWELTVELSLVCQAQTAKTDETIAALVIEAADLLAENQATIGGAAEARRWLFVSYARKGVASLVGATGEVGVEFSGPLKVN